MTEEEARYTWEFDDYYSIEPEFSLWGKDYPENGNRLPEGFTYTSNNNSWWLTQENVKQMLKDL